MTISFLPRHHTIALAAVLTALLAGCGSTPPPAKPGRSRPPTAAPSRPPASPPASDAAISSPMLERPADGKVVKGFDGKTSKGVDIEGTAGAPVRAAADGEVVLVSSALRAYGTMIIVRHDDTYLTAYAQVGKVLVKEKENVRRGQQIAEMGNGPGGRGLLHFEMRRKGVAIDPEPHLALH